MRLGYIDYLNCYPFYFHMFKRKPVDGARIFPALPSDLNRMMASDELDMSPISAATCADLGDDIALLPDFCLSSVGYVASVVLRSKVPIEDLHGRVIGVSSASKTSAVLLKVLLQRYYKVEPEYRTTSPSPLLTDIDAALIIGNDALTGSRQPAPYSYDLGELWLRKTGFPVVFAVFAVRTDSLTKYGPKVGEVIESYRKSLSCLRTEKDNVISGARERYPDIIYDIDSYYRLLQFEFTDELKRALRFYLDTAAEMKLLDPLGEVNYLKST